MHPRDTDSMSKPKTTHGGTRPNAGRKPRAVPRVPITVRLEPGDAAKLRQECKRLGVSQAEWVAGKVNR
jgi:hypothetical protein